MIKMNKIRLNTLHRYVGIILAPFLVLQAVTGLMLSFGIFRRHAGVPSEIRPSSSLDQLLVKLHFGPGFISDAYHILLGLGILWMAVTGWVLYLRLRRARKAAKSAVTKPSASSVERS